MEAINSDIWRVYTEGKNIDKDKVRYYIRWAERYTNYLAYNNNSGYKGFLILLEESCQIWQINQARDAILYLEHYEKKYINKDPDIQRSDSNITWEDVIKEMVLELRLQHKSYNTEKTYLYWLKDFIRNTDNKKPSNITQKELKTYLTYLAVSRNVSVSTQKQAFNALLFLYKYIIKIVIDDLNYVVKSKVKKKLPVVLSAKEIKGILKNVSGVKLIMLQLIYGAGLRLDECLCLRIKDIDLEGCIVTVRSGKGDKDRITILPKYLVSYLEKHIIAIKDIYNDDRENRVCGVELPGALSKKYPKAGEEWLWFWLFPANKLSIDPRTKQVRRYHIYPSTLQKTFHIALQKSSVTKNASIHTLRHSFATHLFRRTFLLI
jgi:integron integrase